MPIVATRPEAAIILDVTVKSIGDWKKEEGFPHREDGQYDTDAILAWRETKQQQRAKSTSQNEQISLATKLAKLKILEIKRQADELELEKTRGKLFERELVLELLAILTSRIRDATNNLQRSGDVTAARMIIEQVDLAKKQINDRIDAAARDSQK